MQLVALLVLLAAACGGGAPSPAPDGGGGAGTGGGGSGGGGGAAYAACPQHRVEGPECTSTTNPDGVRRKDGLICANCRGLDTTGQPTEKPIGCTTIAGGDLCVADCNECS